MPMRPLRSARACLCHACFCLVVMMVAGCSKPPEETDSASPPAVSAPQTDATAAEPEAAGMSLENTHWRLLQVTGHEPAITPADRAEAYFILMSDDRQMQGFSGCNRMGGPYETDGRSLKFGPVHATRMACMDARNPEAGFMQALDATAGTRISDDKLELLDANGAALATFQARINPAG
jgi:heat shock protein HslJ